MVTEKNCATLAKPFTKTDLYGIERTPAQRLGAQREALYHMRRLLDQFEDRTDHAAADLTEENLQSIADAVEMATRAVENMAYIGHSSFTPWPVETIKWRR